MDEHTVDAIAYAFSVGAPEVPGFAVGQVPLLTMPGHEGPLGLLMRLPTIAEAIDMGEAFLDAVLAVERQPAMQPTDSPCWNWTLGRMGALR